jgi:hypothetical protein
MPAMHMLRKAVTLSRLVLAWFVLTLGVAVASPLVRTHAMELVCSDGGLRLVAVAQDPAAPAGSVHGLDCPLCLAVTLPPAVGLALVLQPRPADRTRVPGATAPRAAVAGAPLPPRGPPDVPDFA